MSKDEKPDLSPLFPPPILDELNKTNREFWDRASRLVEKRVNAAPSAALAAVNQISDMIGDGVPAKWVPSFESLVLKGTNSLEQSERGRNSATARKERKLDAIEEFIVNRMNKDGATAKSLWDDLIDEARRANEFGELRASEDGSYIRIVADDDNAPGGEKAIREISENSFPTILNRLKQKINK